MATAPVKLPSTVGKSIDDLADRLAKFTKKKNPPAPDPSQPPAPAPSPQPQPLPAPQPPKKKTKRKTDPTANTRVLKWSDAMACVEAELDRNPFAPPSIGGLPVKDGAAAVVGWLTDSAQAIVGATDEDNQYNNIFACMKKKLLGQDNVKVKGTSIVRHRQSD